MRVHLKSNSKSEYKTIKGKISKGIKPICIYRDVHISIPLIT